MSNIVYDQQKKSAFRYDHVGLTMQTRQGPILKACGHVETLLCIYKALCSVGGTDSHQQPYEACCFTVKMSRCSAATCLAPIFAYHVRVSLYHYPARQRRNRQVYSGACPQGGGSGSVCTWGRGCYTGRKPCCSKLRQTHTTACRRRAGSAAHTVHRQRWG